MFSKYVKKCYKKDFYFQQDGATPHFALIVHDLLDSEFSG